MPAYNVGQFIAETIDSVIEQNYEDWELLVIDDESKDNTVDVVKAYQQRDSRIKYFWQQNGKQGKARNKGIAESMGKYIAFMDADDIWLPDKLERQIKMLEEENVDLVFGHSFLIDRVNKTEIKTGRGQGYYQGESAVKFLLYHDAFVMSTVLAKKEALDKVGRFVEERRIQYCEDWHIWLKLAFEGFSFFSDGKVVSYYRIHENSAAMTEKEAKSKFFYALVDLYYSYPNNSLLQQEVQKRAYDLVFHNETLNEELLDSITTFMKKESHFNFINFLYKPIYRINISIFRKVFLFLNKEKSFFSN